MVRGTEMEPKTCPVRSSLDGVLVFAEEYYCRYSPRNEEDRSLAIRDVGGIEIAVVFTLRGERRETIRIISVRRAKRRERRQYHAHLCARGPAPD
jgi:uncharacterized DUF497 family protein